VCAGRTTQRGHEAEISAIHTEEKKTKTKKTHTKTSKQINEQPNRR